MQAPPSEADDAVAGALELGVPRAVAFERGAGAVEGRGPCAKV
jgi:hypothetical protein